MRHVRDASDLQNARNGGKHGEPADDDWQRGGHDAPKDDEEHEQREWQAHELRDQEIRPQRRIEVGAVLRLARVRDVKRAGLDRVVHRGEGVLGVGERAAQRNDGERLVPIGRDELLADPRRGLDRREHGGDLGHVRERVERLAHLRIERWIVDRHRVRPEERDHVRTGGVAERLLCGISRLRRLEITQHARRQRTAASYAERGERHEESACREHCDAMSKDEAAPGGEHRETLITSNCGAVAWGRCVRNGSRRYRRRLRSTRRREAARRS